MKIRLESGITFVEYRGKLGQLSDALAGLKIPTDDGECSEVATIFREAYDCYNTASGYWAEAIKQRGNSAESDSESSRKYFKDKAAAQEKLRDEKWTEAQRKADRAIERTAALTK